MSRQERVKVERPGVKGVFAFFLLPQFWRSFGHFSHIKPIFIRTLALMLEQSGLLTINHPATRYSGVLVDGRPITVRSVMGEAWYHLRTRKEVGVYQWSMFGSIVMMFAIFIGSIAMAVMYILSGAVAEAQIFGLTGNATDLTTVPVLALGPGAAGFDTRDPGGTAIMATSPSGDLAIGILDKVLRQGATGSGGVLQNGIAAMYGTYSAAVLIIASILVFWSIVSIVVDSARTGQFGGGRHNMVWTPIRFVFALGILVPIGGGFSSGQMLVMKLAEWGSNLGSNMWGTYVANTSTPDLLVSGLYGEAPADSLILPYIDALICMKKNNMEAEVAHGASLPVFGPGGFPVNPTGFPPPEVGTAPGAAPHPEWIKEETYRTGPPDPAVPGDLLEDDTYQIKIGNLADPAKCGTITVQNPSSRFLDGSIPGAPPPDAIADFKRMVRIAQTVALNDIKAQMELFACAYASKGEASPASSYPETCPINLPATPDGVTIADACNFDAGGTPVSGGWTGSYPSPKCKNKIVSDYMASYNTAVFGVTAVTPLPYTDNFNIPDPVFPADYTTVGGVITTGLVATQLGNYMDVKFVPQAQADGWAGMGAWYYNIASINRTASGSTTTNSSGNAGPGSRDEKGKDECSFWQVGFLASGCTPPKPSPKSQSMLGAIMGGGFINYAFNLLKSDDGAMLVGIGRWGQNTHPIAQIAATGDAIVVKSLWMYNAIMVINLAAAIPGAGKIVTATMAGPIGGVLSMIASFGMLPGIMLLYYVPIIPWVRVTFAVLAWIVSVVEAVTTLPIIALAHIRTDGEGLMGPMTQGAYVAWLNLLLRPGLTVIGFVMGGLIFQSMVLYANDTFNTALSAMGEGGHGILDQVLNTYLYVMTIYALVNASFKLVDIIPNSTMGWLGGAGAQDFSGETSIIGSGIQEMGGEFAQGMGQAMARPASMAGTRGMIGGGFSGFFDKDDAGKRGGLKGAIRGGFSGAKKGYKNS